MRALFASVLVLVVTFALASACAGSEGGLSVEQIEFCAEVRDRTPVGAADTFPPDIARVCCFTKIVGAQDTTSVAHVWYFGDSEMARVDLSVKSPSWRTWSTKRMAPQWKGTWRVDVMESDTTVVASKEFVLE